MKLPASNGVSSALLTTIIRIRPQYEVTGPLWFDQFLKGTFGYPQIPDTVLELKTGDGVPVLSVTPDRSREILAVDIYYTQHGQLESAEYDRDNTINRFWHHAHATRQGQTWTAKLPLSSTGKSLWAYANVVYPLEHPVSGAGYYYAPYLAKTFHLSSLLQMATPAQLEAANVQATLGPSLVIETFEGDWQKQWFTYQPEHWGRRTHKIHDDLWQAPPGAALAFDVRSAQANKLVVGIDEFAAEMRDRGRQPVVEYPPVTCRFSGCHGMSLPNWNDVKELRLSATERLRSREREAAASRVLGANWQGPDPEFRNLRWIVDEKLNR